MDAGFAMFLFLLVRMFGTVSTKLESSVFFCDPRQCLRQQQRTTRNIKLLLLLQVIKLLLLFITAVLFLFIPTSSKN